MQSFGWAWGAKFRVRGSSCRLRGEIPEFPKIRGTLIWGPYNKDPTFRVPC